MMQLRPALEASPVQELLTRLDELAAMFRGSAAEGERLARLPRHVESALIEHGLFRLWIPKRCAGFELDLPAALQIYAAAARLDGSIGWAVMIGSGGGLFAAFLEPMTATAIFARPDAVIAGSGAPAGRAVKEKGGYRVTGYWRYASGAHYATTFTANCLVMENGAPLNDSSGRPVIRAMAFEVPQVTILPVWDPTGMRGTGSDDFEVRDAFVPEHRTFSLAEAPRESGPLYRLSFGVLTELPVTAVAVGIARHALDAFAHLARAKTVRPGDNGLLASEPLVQATFASATSSWQFVQSALDELARHAWETVLAGQSLSARELARICAGCTHSVATLRGMVDELIALAGMAALEPESALGRAGRDLRALAAHGSVSPRHLATAGATLLQG